MITGAAHDMENDVVALLGFTTSFEPFMWRLSGFSGTDLLGGDRQYAVIQMEPQQTEGLAWASPDSVLLTNELSAFGPAKLWAMQLPINVGIERWDQDALRLFPNPACCAVRVAGLEGATDVRVMDIQGREVWSGRLGSDGSFPVHHLQPGTYLVELPRIGARARTRLVVQR